LTVKDAYPVITIDGPSGAGKGAAAQALADQFGFHLLDSGAVYRAAALHALNCQANIDDEASVMAALSHGCHGKPAGHL